MAYPADRIVTSAKLVAASLVAAWAMSGPATAQQQPLAQQGFQADPNAADAGKEHNEFVFVRDSASAQEKVALAEKMERLKEWNKSADLYQEVLEKYRDRVIQDGTDKKGVINRYTSVTWRVLQRLSKWPQEGLDVYRGRYETKAATLLNSAHGDDIAPLYEAFRKYFVTESAKLAGIRLIDANLERGEYAAAAEIGDQLLTVYPKSSLIVERPAVLFRTALAYQLTGDPEGRAKAAERTATLTADYPKEMGVVRGKDVALADAIKTELASIGTEVGVGAMANASAADSWPTFGGGPSRGVISTAKANAGTRLYSVPMARPNFAGLPNAQTRQQMQQAYDAAGAGGLTIGVMPVVDRGELFFQDGTRVYAVSLESGVPLPGWLQTYPASNGQFMLSNVVGSTRSYQQSLTITDRNVLAVMGQQDKNMMMYGVAPTGESRLVCLDRVTGREAWTVSLSTSPDVPKNDDEKAIRALALCGAPLIVGDTVLAIGKSSRNTQGEDCYVLSFDLATGKFRWACYVASSGVPANAMYGMPQTTNDNISHLAYANGRVFCLTNLGAVAALDAYSGTIVWLDIYPLDLPQVNMRGGFNPFMDGRGGGSGPKLKAWQHNPVILSDGKAFVLPAEGKTLMVYDAASGKEVKRIGLDVISRWIASRPAADGRAVRPTTLLGVMGNKMLLAGDDRLVYIDWVKYDDETFPGGGEMDQVFWYSFSNKPFAGRPFFTATAVYAPAGDKIRRVDLNTGLAVTEYPPHPRVWDEGEGPGNVVVSGDYVVMAGASGVDVYTDLGLATAKLDREVTAAPSDPEPRLRYAEVMFVAGQADASIQRLDEAIKLMGGIEKLQAGVNRDRLFNDALTFAVKASVDERAGARDRVVKYFDRAAASAGNAQQYVQYRVARAKFADAVKDPTTAVRLYQEILASADTRSVTLLDEQTNAPAQADDVAEKAIAAIVKANGPSIYEAYEDQAKTALAATQGEDDAIAKAGKLLALSQAYPNSTVAPQAMLAAADAFESSAKPREAVRVLRQMWFKFQSGSSRALILEGIARNYLAVPDRNRADMAGTATARLAMAAAMPGDPKLSRDLKLPDGTVLATSGTPIAKALDEVRKLSSSEAGKSLPDFRLLIPKPGQKPYPKAFLPQTAEMTLPDASTLVLPSREFSRPDRVVTWSPGGLSIFATGKGVPSAPLSRSKAFPELQKPAEGVRVSPDAPRGVSWAGDTALVWGGSRAVAIDATTGKTLWTIELNEMAALDVVRGGDAPGSVAVNDQVNGNGGIVVINGRVMNGGVINGRAMNNVVIRGGGIVQINGQAIGQAQQPAQVVAPALPAPPIVGAGEQVADVRPIGDRVIVTSSTGRIISADLAAGRVNWQTRLAERTPDRVVATEDFTVVRVSDDLTVRLFAIDTFSGRVIGNKAFAVQSNSVPVNMALSADGTLVYTLPDRLCLRDLYKAWDEDEKVITSNPPGQAPQPIYAGASQPGQLIIAEGRILAVADNSVNQQGLPPNEKYVRVHSLETGQPLSLKYTVDGNNRELDQLLTSGTKDWNVTLRTIGSRLYVIGPKTVYGYNLDKPAEKWRGSTDIDSFGAGPPDMNVRDAFIGTTHLVLLDQPTTPGVNEYRLHAFARYPSQTATNAKGESGKLDYSVTISDPAGLAPQWQACDGGFFYSTSDGKVRALLGSDQGR